MLMRARTSLSASLRNDSGDNAGLITGEEETLSPQPAAINNEDGNRPRKKRVKVNSTPSCFSLKTAGVIDMLCRVWIHFVASLSSS